MPGTYTLLLASHVTAPDEPVGPERHRMRRALVAASTVAPLALAAAVAALAL